LHLKFNNPENAHFLANSGLFFDNLINQVLNRHGFQDFRKTLMKLPAASCGVFLLFNRKNRVKHFQEDPSARSTA